MQALKVKGNLKYVKTFAYEIELQATECLMLCLNY